MKVIEYLGPVILAVAAVVGIFWPDKLRADRRRLTRAGWVAVASTIVGLVGTLGTKFAQDAAAAKKRKEYLDRVASVQSQIAWYYTATLRATLDTMALEFLKEEQWRTLHQVTDLGRAAHQPDLKPDACFAAVRPLLVPLTYSRVLDVQAQFRGHPIPDEDRTWRQILVAQLRSAHEGIAEMVQVNRHEIPFSLEQRLSLVGTAAKKLAEIYEQHEEEKKGREYIERYLPYLLWNATMANGQIIRIQVGAE